MRPPLAVPQSASGRFALNSIFASYSGALPILRTAASTSRRGSAAFHCMQEPGLLLFEMKFQPVWEAPMR